MDLYYKGGGVVSSFEVTRIPSNNLKQYFSFYKKLKNEKSMKLAL